MLELENESNFLCVNPILLAKNLLRTIEFWEKQVGFKAVVKHGNPVNFAIVKRGEAQVMLCQAPEGATLPVPNYDVLHNCNQISFHIKDVTALYEELAERGTPYDYTLHDTPWKTRNFGIQDPDGYDIGFYQRL